MSVRGGRSPREPAATPEPAPSQGRRANPYARSGRYGRGPGDQRRYERYGDRGGGLGGVLRFSVFLVVLAALVLVAMGTVARPLVRTVIAPWAEDNPGALRVGFVADLVREDLGAALTTPASTDATAVEFLVDDGDTPVTLAPRLLDAKIITSEDAFLFEARMGDLAPKLSAGRFGLALNLTPAQVVQGLVENKVVSHAMPVTFREGLRLEQITAKLLTLTDSKIDAQAFYDLVKKPTKELLADYPWLNDPKVRPDGASLEGFLYPATYTIRIDDLAPTTAQDLVRMMLDAFYEKVGAERLEVPDSRGLSFHEVLTMASIVEREAILDSERPLIAGVYENRLNPKKWPTGLLQSDPTIFYVHDTLKLADTPFADWTKYVFWDSLPDGYTLPKPLPADIAGYNTYTSKGLPPEPIASPAIASIDAALAPDTKTGYLFFIAKGDGTDSSAFAKTKAEHDKNVAKYKKS